MLKYRVPLFSLRALHVCAKFHMLIYDALYRWCRDATGETHDWVSHQPKGVRAKPEST